MNGPDGFPQGYNAQAAVDAEAQIIVALGLADGSADSGQLVHTVQAIRANPGCNPAPFSAADGGAPSKPGSRVEAMLCTVHNLL